MEIHGFRLGSGERAWKEGAYRGSAQSPCPMDIKKGGEPRWLPSPLCFACRRELHVVVHAAGMPAAARRGSLLFGLFDHERFGREDKARDGSRVL